MQQNDLGLLRSHRSVDGVQTLLSPFNTQKVFTRFRSVIGAYGGAVAVGAVQWE